MQKKAPRVAPATPAAPAPVAVTSPVNAPASGLAVSQAPQAASATYALNTTFGPYAKVLANPNSARGRTLLLAVQHAPNLAALQAAWLAQQAQQGVHHSASKFTLGTSKSNKPHQAWGGWLRWLTCNNVKGGQGYITVAYPKA